MAIISSVQKNLFPHVNGYHDLLRAYVLKEDSNYFYLSNGIQIEKDEDTFAGPFKWKIETGLWMAYTMVEDEGLGRGIILMKLGQDGNPKNAMIFYEHEYNIFNRNPTRS